MGLFYTGKGDGGESIVGVKKIDKTSLEIEAVGDLDELNSLIGVIKSLEVSGEFKSILNNVQENLFIIQANVANFMFEGEDGAPKYKAPAFGFEKVAETEKLINIYEEEVNPGRGFIISGSNQISAWLDYVRAVSRRIERSVLKFSKEHELNPEIMRYLNRLSSLLFAMARVNSKRLETKEENPKYK